MTERDTKTLEWAENLPEGCPPSGASPPSNKTYFRLVDEIPPSNGDFCSQRILYPAQVFRVSECIARALSLFSSEKEAVKMRKFPRLKHKKLVAITLPPESGYILQTSRKNHFSWWRTKSFNPIANCMSVDS